MVAGLCLAGLAYRLVFVFDQVGRIDGDNAVVGLMARHILEGRHYVFFWGQHYLGTLEPYSIAAAGALFGLNDLVLRGVPLIYGALYMASFYWLGRSLGDERTGRATLAAAALCPPLLAVWSSSPRGGYPEALFLGQAVLLLALHLARAPSGRRADGGALLLGLVAGLALWTHFLSITFLLVAAWVCLRADPGAWLRRRGWIAAVAFFAGSLPLWAYNLRHGFASFDLAGGAGGGASPLRSARMLLVMNGPKLLGIRDLVGDQSVLLGPFGFAAGALLVTAILWSILRPAGGVK
ncbi:MAG: hypothetical protein ACREQY_13060, partial [Candidatus Binatia bacterium]